MAIVFVPYNLRKITGGEPKVTVPGETLGELVENLEATYPGFADYVLQDGRLKPGLAAICGSAATRQGLLQPLEEGTEVHFVPAVSGG